MWGQSPSSPGALRAPGPGLWAQPCLPARAQDNILLYQPGPANLLYQRQLTLPASQGLPMVTVPLGRGCPSTLSGAPKRELGTPHTGEWWLWSLPLGTVSGLVLVVAAWHAPCPSLTALSLVVPGPLSLSLPLSATLPCCMHGQPPALPLPGTCFPALRAYSSGRGCNELLRAGFALLVERMETEMWEQDKEAGLRTRLWGRIRCWATGWAAAGCRIAQCPGDASSCRAGWAARATLVSAAESAAVNGNLFWWHQPIRQGAGARLRGKAGYLPEPVWGRAPARSSPVPA